MHAPFIARLFGLLENWVEKGESPLPARCSGRGNPTLAASFESHDPTR